MSSTMRFKMRRLGPLLLETAADPSFYRQVHVMFGGTGAVGGATALHLIDLFEEAILKLRPRFDDQSAELGLESGPRVVITGRTRQEVRRFTSLLFGIQMRDHGRHPEHLPGVGYRSVGGVVVELGTFGVDPSIPELVDFARLDEERRRDALDRFLAQGGLDRSADSEAIVNLLETAIDERVGRPFSRYLREYQERRGLPTTEGGDPSKTRFRSVVVGIPLVSVATYKLVDLEQAAAALGLETGSREVEDLKSRYLRSMRDDLAEVEAELADEVLAAHTTAVGGMYDEEGDGKRIIRLGFAHSALGDRMRDKQLFAERLAALYAERGIKMLITAAAIGVDSVLMGKVPPINGAIRQALAKAAADGHEVVPVADRSGALKVYEPKEVPLLIADESSGSVEESDEHAEGDEPKTVRFAHGSPLILDYVLKSGENGFFTVSNTDALYRVMRVTSSSELGLLLARTALFGDDVGCPAFRDSVCYYTETDNSRQVFDLLSLPQLRFNQLGGLQPKALQDLGSAKHQGELHTLGLLILLYRLRTLDLDSIPHPVDLATFDPKRFFERNSRPLTLDRLPVWTVKGLADDFKTLVTAKDEQDLEEIKHLYQTDPDRQEAAQRVLSAVLRATWAVPSLGSPIVWEDDDGRRRVLTGPYAGPVDLVVTHENSLDAYLRGRFRELGGDPEDQASFDLFVEFQIANYGFVDLRPIAVLITARTAFEGDAGLSDLDRKVQIFRDEESFVAALDNVEPFSYFTSSGLIALLVRLKGLALRAGELDLRFGSSNEFRAQLPFDDKDRPLLVPGVVEAFRMVSEGLEKNTGSERLDGRWGYGAKRAE